MTGVDQWIAFVLAPLGVWILLSGLDDLVLVAACLSRWHHDPGPPTPAEMSAVREKRLAVFLPLWHEAEVIGHMVEHNVAAIRYRNYDFFIGAYPNDTETLEAVRRLEQRFANVHLAVCPHDGPTSKADCLNWVYQHMLAHEETHGDRFEVMVTHDAEDLIHPEALRWINYYTQSYDMVQIPVLPLATSLTSITHGVYCDEFAEYQSKDIPARLILKSFLPSNGVGTGYTRRALERLARADSNQIFDPTSLTEDYENGLRIHMLGLRQFFVPIRFLDGNPVATREYFPRTFCDSIKQRQRWVMGLSLQSWERHGWHGNWRQVYWLWRDRKGLIGSPVTLATNVIFLYGVADWILSRILGIDWGVGRAVQYPFTKWLMISTLVLQLGAVAIRTGCVRRIYGWRFALGVPLRIAWANWLNMFATMAALAVYARAKLKSEPLRWIKTQHAYPSRGALAHYLLETSQLDEKELYEALSLQLNVPLGRLEPEQVSRRVARALPAHMVERWSVLPFHIQAGEMYLAGPLWPDQEARQDLRRFTRMGIRFQLITPRNFEQLRRALQVR
jgi:bacteriophage N4 adsorption protein B